MKIKYLSVAVLSAMVISGCNDNDTVDGSPGGGNPPVNPGPDIVFDVENTFWDLEATSATVAANSTATAIAYYFTSDNKNLKTFWVDGSESYYISSTYSISGKDTDPSSGTLTFSLDDTDNSCKFAVTDKQTLDLTECTNSNLDVTTYKATSEREEEFKQIPEKESDKDVVNADFEWDFSTLPGGQATTGGRDFSVRNDEHNPKEIVDGAKEFNGAVKITQSETKHGFYHLAVEGSGSDDLVFPDGTFSAELVFRVDNYLDYNQNLQLIDITDGNSTGWKLVIDRKTMLPEARVNDGSGKYTAVRAVTPIEIGKYMHVMLTVNSTETKIYVNGTLETKRALNFVPNKADGDTFYLAGGSTTIKNNLEGAIDNFALFEDVLSEEQVQARAELFGFKSN
ncbi:LamG domain-containing protein [Vibrio maritimus]|uniref:LamG domain-containing protein n=1 Tax=Vibrio maritimus TaxID=990268 RepID=UPI003735A96C